MIRAVIDTNVLISGVAGSTTPAQVVDAWRQNRYVLVTSPQLIAEVSEVMHRPKIMDWFRLTEEDISSFIGTLSTRAYVASGTLRVDVIKNDPPDNCVLSTAVEGTADFIVTGNERHLLRLGTYQSISIVTPSVFLSRING